MKTIFATWLLISGFAVVLRSYQGMPLHCAFDAAMFTLYAWLYAREARAT